MVEDNGEIIGRVAYLLNANEIFTKKNSGAITHRTAFLSGYLNYIKIFRRSKSYLNSNCLKK